MNDICPECGTAIGLVAGLHLKANGGSAVLLVCAECGTRIGERKKALFPDWEKFPVLVQAADCDKPKCSVMGCQSHDTELHHFAPRQFWGKDDAEHWPKAYLCRDHHLMWHRVMDREISYTGDAVLVEFKQRQSELFDCWQREGHNETFPAFALRHGLDVR